tara:strand:+ start:380 stop:1102 length:723 start_codon:yes stop_codon:yes gene_type:complete
MHIITSNGNKIELNEDDEKIKEYLYNNKHCAQIIVNQINNQRIYDQYLSNKKDLVILDIGANIGLFTLYAKDSASKIISVEPTESHHYIFEKLTGDYDNIELSKVALSDNDGPITFYICEDNLTMNSLVNKKSKSVEVQGLCFESLLKKHDLSRVDFCKIDIEGSEMIAITEEKLKPVFDKIDRIFIEVHATIPTYTHDYEWQEDIIVNRRKLQEICHNVGYKTEVLPGMYKDTFYAYKD